MIIHTPILIQSIIAGAVLIATIFAVAWYLPKLSPMLSSSSKASKNKEQPKDTLSATRQESGRPSWLDEIVKHDKERISECFRMLCFQWILGDVSEPYIIASVNLVNSSIFTTKVTGVTGSFFIDKVKCNLPTTIKRECVFERTASDVIQIRQPINIETLKVLKQKLETKSQILMELYDVSLTAQILEPEHKPKPIEIKRILGSHWVTEMTMITK